MKRRRYPLRGRMAVNPQAFLFDYPEASAPAAQLQGGVAVLTIEGPLEQVGGWWWQGYDQIATQVAEAMARDEVWALVLRLRSPGGDFAGMLACAEQLRALARKAGKPLVAAVDEEACSAAYCIASAADVIVVPPGGVVGSIGVVTKVGDRTEANKKAGLNIQVIGSGKYKGELSPDTPLTKETLARVQGEIDYLAGLFADLVAAHRSQLTRDAVLALEADCFRGQAAVDAGLADLVGTFADALDVARRRADAARSTPKTTAARPQPTRTAMNREQLIKFLGLAADATDAQINEALAARAAIDDQIKALAGATTIAEAVGKLGASVARLATFEASAEENEKKNKQSVAQKEIDALVAGKRLLPTMKAFALSIHGSPSWEPFVASLPGGQGGSRTTQGQGAKASAEDEVRPPAPRTHRDFDDEELADIAASGLTPEQARVALVRGRANGAIRNDEENI